MKLYPKKGKVKVYDCFPYFNEELMLELRLNTHYDYVDYFIIVESTKTFTRKEKPLYFNEIKAKFAKF